MKRELNYILFVFLVKTLLSTQLPVFWFRFRKFYETDFYHVSGAFYDVNLQKKNTDILIL
ncbi:MAG: hypothetical protein C0430_10055 [Flavobacterium sp.]|nr:hypothetical protein [Flavobacterium sp.]